MDPTMFLYYLLLCKTYDRLIFLQNKTNAVAVDCLSVAIKLLCYLYHRLLHFATNLRQGIQKP